MVIYNAMQMEVYPVRTFLSSRAQRYLAMLEMLMHQDAISLNQISNVIGY